MTPPLETSRLLLRPLELADAGAIQAIFPQWEVVKYLANRIPWPYPPDGALTFIRDIALPAMERGEEWHWTLRLKTAPEQVIGKISLARDPGHNRGFWLDPAWHRRGLMTEACDAVTDYWFQVLGEPLLQAPKAAANTASRRISEKQGMRLVETREGDFISGRQPGELWEITAEEWRSRKPCGAGLHPAGDL